MYKPPFEITSKIIEFISNRQRQNGTFVANCNFEYNGRNYWNRKKVTVKVTQKVTVNQQKILDLIKENQFITQEELSKNIGIARKSVISNMKKLQDVGLINGLLKTFVNIGILDEKTGFNRNRYYVFEDYIKIFR